jgi:hypothetical protein
MSQLQAILLEIGTEEMFIFAPGVKGGQRLCTASWSRFVTNRISDVIHKRNTCNLSFVQISFDTVKTMEYNTKKKYFPLERYYTLYPTSSHCFIDKM